MNTSTQTRLTQCDHCHLKPQCLADRTLESDAAKELNRLVIGGRALPRGAFLYREGEPREFYYFLRTGAAKSFAVDASGEEHVYAFHFPTEMIGAASLEQARHTESVVLLERSFTCAIPAEPLERLCRANEPLMHSFFSKVSASFAQERRARLRVAREQVTARLADFVLDIADRMATLGRRDDVLTLPMSRYDIANFIGVAVETVSRAFRELQNAGLLEVSGRQITIRSPRDLAQYSGKRARTA
ncbi:MAG: Crp/Fnr family transcriptional regulator [Gammaproteobacteria bacterium]